MVARSAPRSASAERPVAPQAARARPPRIGLTGGIGSGKSTVAATLAALGAALVDSDAIARELTVAGGAAVQAIREEFGPDLIDGEGALDRARMRALVFDDAAARARLERLLHPLIRARGEALAADLQSKAPYIVFDVPLLVESGAGGRYDRILVVDCPLALQIERVTARSGLSPSEARAIIARQAGRAARLDAADDVIVNAGSLAALRARVGRLHQAYARGGV